jgi:hypothetical protein
MWIFSSHSATSDELTERTHLELSVRAGDGYSGVVTHDLGSDHCQSLTLGRVDFARHDGRSRLVLGQAEFTETTPRSRTEVADIVGNLHEGDGQGIEGAGSLDNGIVCCKRLELA